MQEAESRHKNSFACHSSPMERSGETKDLMMPISFHSASFFQNSWRLNMSATFKI
ncbi:hypothetical protein JOD97_001657 [Duganella sp. 1411]|nr:hypothetical protein [Duganella sp. 1411]